MYVNFNKLNDQIQKERIKAFKKFDLELKKAYFLQKNIQFQLTKKELLNFIKSLKDKKDN